MPRTRVEGGRTLERSEDWRGRPHLPITAAWPPPSLLQTKVIKGMRKYTVYYLLIHIHYLHATHENMRAVPSHAERPRPVDDVAWLSLTCDGSSRLFGASSRVGCRLFRCILTSCFHVAASLANFLSNFYYCN